MEEKVLEIQEELRRAHVQYGETCHNLSILEEKVYQLVKQMERLNEELSNLRTNNQ